MLRIGLTNTYRFIIAFLAVALALAMAIPLPFMRAEQASATVFPDIPDDFWARTEIAYMAEKGIVAGKPDGRFDPSSPVTRGQFALMLYRALELPAGQARFKDVQPDTLLGKAVGAIVEKGIARGYPDGTYRPNQPITRGQMAVIIVRVLGLEDEAIANKHVKLPFADRFVETQRGYIYVVSHYWVMQGSERNGKQLFRAGHSASRAETAVIFYRMLSLMEQDRFTDRDPSNVKEKAYPLANLVKGELPASEGTAYYQNPLHNERWVVWMAERTQIDPALPVPDGLPASTLRQAVLSWYDSKTGAVQQKLLPYVFAHRQERTNVWDEGTFKIPPPAFFIDRNDVYLVYPDRPQVLYIVDLQTGNIEARELERPVEWKEFPYTVMHQRPGLLPLEKVYEEGGLRIVHVFYDVDSDAMVTFEGHVYSRLYATEKWAVWYDVGERAFLVYDRKKRETVRQFSSDESPWDIHITGEWLIVTTKDEFTAFHLETGEQRGGLFSEHGHLLANHPQANQVLLEKIDLAGSELVNAFVYDFDRGKLEPFEGLSRFKRNQILDLSVQADRDGRVYLVSMGSGQYGYRAYLFDWESRSYLGSYNFDLDRFDRLELVGIQNGGLIALWYRHRNDSIPADVKILRVPLKEFSR
jgi:hypothetical protein